MCVCVCASFVQAVPRSHGPRPDAWNVGLGKASVPLELHEREGGA